jgi:Fic family protein
VPPPPDDLVDCLGSLEKFLHDETAPSTLVRAALAHLQFETIHPFLDGNGRIGRLLITLLLVPRPRDSPADALPQSLYLKKTGSTYYELLQTGPHRRRLGGVARSSSSPA